MRSLLLGLALLVGAAASLPARSSDAAGGGGTYTAISCQYRSGIDTPISVAPNDPLRVTIWISEDVGGSFWVEFEPGMTRRQIAQQLASSISSLFPDLEVSVDGATVIVEGTHPKTGGTPDKPNESSTNHNRPWLSSYTKTV
jgi:hypothetical protein